MTRLEGFVVELLVFLKWLWEAVGNRSALSDDALITFIQDQDNYLTEKRPESRSLYSKGHRVPSSDSQLTESGRKALALTSD